MSLAFLYAGQGTQHVGMGADLYEAYPAFRDILDRCHPGFDVKQLCFEGPEETLTQTQYTQPCMVAFAAGVTAVLAEHGITPAAAAGLSLGEYSALQAAGVFDPVQAVELVAFRGQAMANAVKDRPCGMAAVLQLDREALAQVCRQAAGDQVVEMANFNCPGQIVIGGDADAVDRACALAKEAGAKRCVPLKVSGPFHTSLMKPAGDALAEKFRTTSFGALTLPVYFNATGKPLADGETIPALLEKQVQSSVYLEDTIRAMEAAGVDTIVEIGPGKALSGFVKKTSKTIKTFPVETVEELKAAVAALKGA